MPVKIHEHENRVQICRTSLWTWWCPSHHCRAPVHESYGRSKYWELALIAANDHARRHHR
jgi:hypothetical protein